jgi:ABC-type dipeptide/oligopeptide/nickel transport system permease component
MSVPERYWHWLLGVFHHGSFGRHTVLENSAIWPGVWSALRQTLELAGASLVVVVALSLTVGVLAARRPGSFTDVLLRGLGYLTWSLPVFLVALGLQELFSRLGASGFHPFALPTDLPNGSYYRAAWIRRETLPVLTVALTFIGGYSRYVRSSMLVALHAPYTVVARAKGLTERRVTIRHALRTALIPFVSVLTLDFGNLFSGTLVADAIFRLGGIGSLFLGSLYNADPYQLDALLAVTAITVVGFSLLADLLFAWLDPRIRLA